MMENLSAFEKKLCNNLQMGLAVCRRPFAEAAKSLGVDEQQVLERTQDLVKRRVIRRIGAVINWRAIGNHSTLVAAHVGQDNLKEVVAAVNAMEGVSHNYLRQHHYNLWFTLRADFEEQVEAILANLSKRFGTAFHSLPAIKIFKLDVRFDAESDGTRLLTSDKAINHYKQVSLDETDKQILHKLYRGLEAAAEPFDILCNDELSIDEVLTRIKKLIDEGAIYRLGAVASHRKLGFVANAMFACEAGPDRIEQLGKSLAGAGNVSHCYERKTFDGWPYNLFGMMHGRSLEDIHEVAKNFVKKNDIKQWQLLATAEEFKKGSR